MIQGSAFYLGVPGSGKTSLAWKHLRELVERDHFPAIIVESVPDARFVAVPRAATIEEVVKKAWAERTSVRFVGSDQEEGTLDALFSAVQGGGCVHLLIDESAFYFNARRGQFAPLPRLLRSYRHANVTIQATTQALSGDVSQEALACAPTLYVFRTAAPAALEALEKRYGIDPSLVRALPLPERRDGGIQVAFLEVSPGGEWRTAEDFVPDE